MNPAPRNTNQVKEQSMAAKKLRSADGPEAADAKPQPRADEKTQPRASAQEQAAPNKKRVLVVDDHPLVRERVSELINQEPDLVVCGEAEEAVGAMEAVEQFRPDIAIVDISLKDTYGIELIKDMKAQHPKVPVLVLSMHDESMYAERALRAGAKGYVNK